jgi:hypothetical protein
MPPTRKKKPIESVDGTYTAIPHRVLDSEAFKGASHIAKSLLLELLRQHNGGNNGHLQLTQNWLKKRGWISGDTIQKAKQELLERGLIVQTKQGGLNIGPSFFALTWLPISNHVGLELRPHQYHRGAWSFMDKISAPNCVGRSASRTGAEPSGGVAEAFTSPPDGSKTTISGEFTSPPDGDNECLPLPTSLH